MKTTSFFLLACIVWLTACCNKPETRPNYVIDQQSKDYTIFKNDSYWVYKSTNNHVLDTNRVISVKNSSGYNSTNNYDYDNVQIKFYTNQHTQPRCERIEAIPSEQSIHLMWFEDARTSTKCLFFSNKAVGNTYNYWFYPDNIVTYQNFLPTYTLEGKTYNEVMVFESIYTGASVPFDDVRLPVKVYFAKHIGIIRKEMKNGDVWNLIHHDVKQ
jgi:hypothetical protein